MHSEDLKLCDPAEGADAGRGRAPVAVLPVLASLQEVLLPPVVGQVVEHPGAVGHHTGVGLTELEGVVHGGAVVGALHHLAAEVRPLVQPHLPGAAVDLRAEGTK